MSVRRQYTIPGWEPAPAASAPGAVASKGLAPWQSGPAPAAAPAPWREVLGLDRPQPGELVLEPPPPPAALSYSDADENRKTWNSLLIRHLQATPANEGEARLVAALLLMHQQEQELTSRLMSEWGR